jgi:hypothetical protein
VINHHHATTANNLVKFCIYGWVLSVIPEIEPKSNECVDEPFLEDVHIIVPLKRKTSLLWTPLGLSNAVLN